MNDAAFFNFGGPGSVSAPPSVAEARWAASMYNHHVPALSHHQNLMSCGGGGPGGAGPPGGPGGLQSINPSAAGGFPSMHPSLHAAVARHQSLGPAGVFGTAHHYPGPMVAAAAAGLVACSGGSGSPTASTAGCCPSSMMYSGGGGSGGSGSQYCAVQQQQQQQTSSASDTSYGGGGPGGQALTPGSLHDMNSTADSDSWRGSSIAELRRKALEHTVSMTGMAAAVDSVYR